MKKGTALRTVPSSCSPNSSLAAYFALYLNFCPPTAA
jgi:hypothetical protein